MNKRIRTTLAILIAIATLTSASAQDPSSDPTYKADVPKELLIPDEVETRLGTLRFKDGLPDDATVKMAYDNLDFMRAVDAFLKGMPTVSLYAFRQGMASAGAEGQAVAFYGDLLDARSIIMTGNTTVIYFFSFFDLKDGPLVFEVPPGLLALANDVYFKYLTDVGAAGPDEGKGGKYLFLPPGYEGEVPEEGYFVVRSPSNTFWLPGRQFVGEDGPKAAAAQFKAGFRVYPWSKRDDPPETRFVDLSGMQLNTVHASDGTFFKELHAAIQGEPPTAFSPELLGLLASIGIHQDKPFSPDERMQKIFDEAAAVGNATVRSIMYAQRDPAAFHYDDRQWRSVFFGGSHEFLQNGAKLFDAEVLFHFQATGITPAMVSAPVGSGTQYVYTERDSQGRYFDGGKTYRIDLPAPVPVKQFWSFVVYDTQHRSMLETDQALAGVDSLNPDLKPNDDGSYTVWFGPKAPEGKEGNWVQTMPGKGWFTYFRLYGPEAPWFEKSWKLGDFELVE